MPSTPCRLEAKSARSDAALCAAMFELLDMCRPMSVAVAEWALAAQVPSCLACRDKCFCSSFFMYCTLPVLQIMWIYIFLDLVEMEEGEDIVRIYAKEGYSQGTG